MRYTYQDLENRSGTIWNKKTNTGYSDPMALSKDLGILPHQIDWTKISAYQAPVAIPAPAPAPVPVASTPAPNLGTMTNEQYLAQGYYGGQQTKSTPIPPPVFTPTTTYSQLENRNGTIYNKQTGQAYSDPAQLASAMGISSDQIDWTKINKSMDYWLEGLPEGSSRVDDQGRFLKKTGGKWIEYTDSTYKTPVGGQTPVSTPSPLAAATTPAGGQQRTLIDIANSRPDVLNTAKAQGGDPFTAGTAANTFLNNWWNTAGKNEYPSTTLAQPSNASPGAGQGATGATGAGAGTSYDPNDPRAVLANALKEQGAMMQKYYDTLKSQPTVADMFKQYSDQLGISSKDAKQAGLMSQINKTEQELNDLEKNITSRITELGEGMSEAQRARQYATEKKQPMEDYTNLVKAYNQGEISLSSARQQLADLMKYSQADQKKAAELAGMPLEYAQKMLPTMLSIAQYQSPQEKLADAIALKKATEEEKTTTDITEYNIAKKQGFTGTLLDWQKQQANLKAKAITPPKSTIGEKYSSRLSTEISNLYSGRYGSEGAREKVLNILKAEFPSLDVAKDIYTRVPDGYEKSIKQISTEEIPPGVNQTLSNPNASIEDIINAYNSIK